MVYLYCIDNCLIWVISYTTPFRDSTGWKDGIGSSYRSVEKAFHNDIDGADKREYSYVYDFLKKEWLNMSSPMYSDRGFYVVDWINLEYDGGRKLISDSTQIAKYEWSPEQKDILRERLKSAREFIKTHNTGFSFEEVIDDTIKFQGELFY